MCADGLSTSKNEASSGVNRLSDIATSRWGGARGQLPRPSLPESRSTRSVAEAPRAKRLRAFAGGARDDFGAVRRYSGPTRPISSRPDLVLHGLRDPADR